MPLKHSGKATIAFLFGALLWKPLNLIGEIKLFHFLSDEASIEREVQKKRNSLEVLLHQAMKSRSLVSVTVNNGKVYVGRVSVTFNPAFGMQAINLVLSRSGHRDTETQEMKLDVDYDKTHDDIKKDLQKRLVVRLVAAMKDNPEANDAELLSGVSREISKEAEIRNYEIVIPIAEVQSVNIFDMEIYEKFFAPKQ